MPHLTLIEKGSERSHRVEGSEVLVGRDPACGIFLDGDGAKTVSGRHARFFFEESKWYVEDAGSRNGTYVGRRKLEPGDRHAVAIGDVIGLGLTGTQLSVREAVGRSFAATMLESAPAPSPQQFAAGTAPLRMTDAVRAGAHVPGAREEVRVVLRGVQSGSRSAGQAERVTIGRALECVIRVEGESATSVSRVHAEMVAVNDQVVLRDGGSRHGTFLNGARISADAPVKRGDVIMLGPGGPTFNVDEVVLAPAAAPGALAPSSAPVREPAIGPTGVRAAAPKAPDVAVADRPEKTSFNAAQPTPLDQPAYRQPTPDQDQAAFRKPTPPDARPARRKPQAAAGSLDSAKPGRLRTAVIVSVGLIVVIATALFFII